MRRARLALDDDEAPWREAAVVGNARGERQQRLEFLRVGPGSRREMRRDRAAGAKQADVSFIGTFSGDLGRHDGGRGRERRQASLRNVATVICRCGRDSCAWVKTLMERVGPQT